MIVDPFAIFPCERLKNLWKLAIDYSFLLLPLALMTHMSIYILMNSMILECYWYGSLQFVSHILAWAYRPKEYTKNVKWISKIPAQPIAGSDAEQLLR